MKTIAAMLALAISAGSLSAQNQTQGNKPVTIIAIGAGQSTITVSWTGPNGQTMTQIFQVIVQSPIATLDLFNHTSPQSWQQNWTVGQTFCAFIVAKDSLGNVIPNAPVKIASSDTTIAKVSTTTICTPLP